MARAAPSVVALEHGRGHGTGVVLDDAGAVLTCAHVVDPSARLRVRFHDGSLAEGKVVGVDTATDLAVVQTARTGQSPATLAGAQQVRVGQVVLALGHPYGFERSASLGVVSALERRLPGRDGAALDGLIQTDAAVNPGNSGGPLLNVRGQVVGLNTAMLPFAQGLGFAVPSFTASWVAALLLRRGAVRRRTLGVAARNEVFTPELAATVGQPRGVRLVDVGARSPAFAAGLAAEDLVLEVNAAPMTTIDELQRALAFEESPTVDLTVWRRSRREHRTVAPGLRAAA